MALPPELLAAMDADKSKYAADDASATYGALTDKSADIINALPPRKETPVQRVALSAPDLVDLYQQARENAPPGINVGSTPQALIERAANEAKAANPAAPASDMPAALTIAPPAQPGTAPAYPAARAIQGGDLDPTTGKLTAQGMMRYGTSGVSPASTDLATQAYTNANAAVAHEQGAIGDAINDMNIGGASREEAARTKLASDMAKNEELAPIYQQRAALEKKNAAEMASMYNTATQETTAQMVRVRSAANDAANAQIKDFWADKSTAGRVIGIISQALAGAANGLSGQPGAATPLDRIINRDLEIQQINMQGKGATAQREQGILGSMQHQFDSNMAAHGAAFIAAVGHTDALAKTIAQKYATPEAMATYQAFHAENLEKVAQATASLHGSLLSSNLQQASTAATILDRTATANAAVKAAEIKAGASGGKIPNHIMGIKGDVNVQQFNALQEHSQATASALDAYQEIQKMMKDKHTVDPAWIQHFNDLASRAFAARRIDQKTGARLEGPELDRINAGVPKLSEGFLGRFTRDNDLLSINKMLGNMIHTETGQYAARVRSVTGLDLDYSDPLIGRHLAAIAQPGIAQ